MPSVRNSANLLARAGIGTLRLADRDVVDWTNLQRQSLFEEADAAQSLPKAEAAARYLKRINSTIRYEPIVLKKGIGAARRGLIKSCWLGGHVDDGRAVGRAGSARSTASAWTNTAPADHLLRSIDRFVELSDIRRQLEPYYSAIGRPSIDPELMIRMLLIGYCCGIRSERRLCEEVHLESSSPLGLLPPV